MTPRTCLCGERLQHSEEYGPVSQMLLKWYENGRSFGDPATRRKFYMCREHTMEMVSYMEALSEGKNAALVVE